MRWFFVLCAIISPTTAYALTRVGVIDSGLDINDPRFKPLLCKDAIHRDFTDHGLLDYDGHGTHIVGLIKKYAGEEPNYCLVIYKFYHSPFSNPPSAFLEALEQALSDNLDIINISGGGTRFYMSEYEAIAAHPEVRVFVAAGNEGADLAVKPYFPAAYPLSNIYAIGNGFSEEDRAPTSSFGKRVKYWEDGQNAESSFPLWKCGYYDRPAGKDCQVKLSGTSMSAAIFTGKWLREIK